MKYTSVGIFSNDSELEIIVYLELLCEEIRVAPGLSFELFIEDIPDALPITIIYLADGLQIYPHRNTPEWLIEFNGKTIKPGYPTVLAEHQ